MSNLVVNGNFDSPNITTLVVSQVSPTSWTVGGTNAAYGIIDFALAGADMNNTPNLAKQWFFMQANTKLSQNITFPKAGDYMLSFWYNINPGQYNSVMRLLAVVGTAGTGIISSSSIALPSSTSTWTQYFIPFSVNSSQLFQEFSITNVAPLSPITEFYLTGIIIVAAQPPCFREGTLISCLKNGAETEVPIENLKEYPYLVKTLKHGYLPIHSIGKSLLQNPGNRERIKTRLYKLTQLNYPEIYTPLYLTGCHGILVPSLSDREKQACQEQYEGKVFVTDGHYRLFTCLDERAEPFAEEGEFPIYHVALQSKDELVNYGIYANGLLVESCSIWSLTEKHKQVVILYPGE